MSEQDKQELARICEKLKGMLDKYATDDEVMTGYIEDAIGNLEELF